MIRISGKTSYDKTRRDGMLNVIDVNYTSVQTGWEHKERFLTANEMILVTAGCVHLTVDRENYDIHENGILLLPKYRSISARRKSDSACSFYSVAFESSPEFTEGLMCVRQERADSCLFLRELLKRMVLLHRQNPSDNTECDALFLTFLYEIRSGSGNRTKSNTPFMQNVLSYIQENIHLPLSIDDLCREFHYSRDSLTKQFRKRFDTSPKNYINRVKLDTAKQLLSTSRMSVEQVGNAVGFDSVQLFYKFFRYHEQITPSAYRNLYR